MVGDITKLYLTRKGGYPGGETARGGRISRYAAKEWAPYYRIIFT